MGRTDLMQRKTHGKEKPVGVVSNERSKDSASPDDVDAAEEEDRKKGGRRAGGELKLSLVDCPNKNESQRSRRFQRVPPPLRFPFRHISSFYSKPRCRTSSTSRGRGKPNPEGMDSHIGRPLDRTLSTEILSSLEDVAQGVPLGGSDEPKVPEAEDGGDEGDDVEERRSRKVGTRSKVVPQSEVENLEMRNNKGGVSFKCRNIIRQVMSCRDMRAELGRGLNEKQEEGRELTRHKLPSFIPSSPELLQSGDKL